VGRIADNSTLTDGLSSLVFVPALGLAAAAAYRIAARRLSKPGPAQ
jgi:hypothetical protein